MFVNDWDGSIRVLIVGALAYFILILWLRFFGKRTLSKWNAFDMVVTIALGSILATVIISKDVPLVEGALALALLIGLQFIITWLAVRVSFVGDLIKAKPAMLFENGQFLDDVLKRERVPESEIRMAVRASGSASFDDIQAVVLETDGSFSVIRRSDNDSQTALKDVSR